MECNSIGFLGGGRIVSILLGGLDRAGVRPRRVVVSDVDEHVLARLKARHGHIRTLANGNLEAAAQELVFVALHPPVVRRVLPEVAQNVRPDAIVVSLAPAVTMAELNDLLGGFLRLVRMLPNAPTIVGWGCNPVSFSYALDAHERDGLCRVLCGFGFCPEVPEDQLEACAVITALGPTFFWPQFYELQAMAERFGLSPECVREGVARTVRGALAVMDESGLSAEEVMDLVPVQPLADAQQDLVRAYRERLPALLKKLRG